MTSRAKPTPAAPTSPVAPYAALTPEQRVRVGTSMKLLLDLKTLHKEGLDISTDILKGDLTPADLAVRLLDFERTLRLSAEEMLRRPLRVAHEEAVRKGRTKLDQDDWLRGLRVKAAEARRAREEEEREARFHASTIPTPAAQSTAEEELVTAPRP